MSRIDYPSSVIKNRIDELLITLCMEYQILPMPVVEWSTRFKRVLGKAYLNERKIKLSAWLSLEQAEETLRHELAHIALGNNSQNPHGLKWKQWAGYLGARPRATSASLPANIDFSNSTKIYKGLECPNCNLRFIRLIVKPRIYCKRCGPKKGMLLHRISATRSHLINWLTKMY